MEKKSSSHIFRKVLLKYISVGCSEKLVPECVICFLQNLFWKSYLEKLVSKRILGVLKILKSSFEIIFEIYNQKVIFT